jgi:hypothetical protein
MKRGGVLRRTALGLVTLAVLFTVAPATAPRASAQSNQVYIAETGHFLGGAFRIFFDQYGGLPQFGFPVTDEYFRAHDNRIVQYFQRARFELLVQPNGQLYVILGNIGNDFVAANRLSFPPVPPVADTPNRRYFPETRHTLQQPFKAYWDANQGATFFGAPISEQVSDGSRLVQYFERARLELNADGSISRGLLGNFLGPCQQKIARPDWLPPSGPQIEGDDRHCNRPQEMPMGTISPAPALPGARLTLLAINFGNQEEVTAWVNYPDTSIRRLGNPAGGTDRSGGLSISFDTRPDDPLGTYSIVALGLKSKRQLVVTYRIAR